MKETGSLVLGILHWKSWWLCPEALKMIASSITHILLYQARLSLMLRSFKIVSINKSSTNITLSKLKLVNWRVTDPVPRALFFHPPGLRQELHGAAQLWHAAALWH